MKILTVLGARPQFIKAAAVSRAIIEKGGIEEVIVHTGQHFDKNMSDIFFDELSIPKPDYNLGINGMSHGEMTGNMLKGVEEILIKEKPDVLMVYGDTNSTIAGALAAKKLHIKVAHVEAGLRSFNMSMPEEVNRILTDRISDYLFCPTETAINNLRNEGFEGFETKIELTGDVMKDAALFYREKANAESTVLSDNEVAKPYVLATCHRAENTDDPDRLKGIFGALEEINAERTVVMPLHPRTKAKLAQLNLSPGIKFIDPVGYLDMIALISQSDLVLTDSGGLQKEAYFFEKQCITMRDETEWTELVANNYNTIVGADAAKIIAAYNKDKNKVFDHIQTLYGNGDASEVICESLMA